METTLFLFSIKTNQPKNGKKISSTSLNGKMAKNKEKSTKFNIRLMLWYSLFTIPFCLYLNMLHAQSQIGDGNKKIYFCHKICIFIKKIQWINIARRTKYWSGIESKPNILTKMILESKGEMHNVHHRAHYVKMRDSNMKKFGMKKKGERKL